jgi:hypothetical protein
MPDQVRHDVPEKLALRPPSDEPASPYIFGDVSGFELSDSFSLDALIGMDILRHCDFEMRRDGLCRLRFGT